MFKIDFFVDDKNLASVLRDLGGRAMNMNVVPVANAKKENGKAVPDDPNDIPGLLHRFALESDHAYFNAGDIRSFCTSRGLSPTSYSNVIHKAVKAGLFKKAGTGTGTRYIPVKRKD